MPIMKPGRNSRQEVRQLRQEIALLQSDLNNLSNLAVSRLEADPDQVIDCDSEQLKYNIARNKRTEASHLECYCELTSLLIRCIFEGKPGGIEIWHKLVAIQKCKLQLASAHVHYAELCKLQCELGDSEQFIDDCMAAIQLHVDSTMPILDDECKQWMLKITGMEFVPGGSD